MEENNQKIDGGATLWARQTIDSDIFLNKPDKWFKIWFYIVNKVYFEDQKDGGKRGERFIKYEWISEKTKATKSEIDHFMRWSKGCRMLATQKATRGMIVKVLKYDTYQTLDNYKSDKKSDLKATQKRHRSDTILKNGNKDKNEKNVFIPTNVGSDLTIADPLESEINQLIPLFEPVNPTYKTIFSNKTERSALIWLLKEFGRQKLEDMIKALPLIINRKFAPKVTTPFELKRDMGKLKAFAEQERSSSNSKLNIKFVK